MKPVIVHLKLPDDLSAKVRELAGDGDVKAVILAALRGQLMPPSLDGLLARPGDEVSVPIYPTYGSIPAEQKRG